MPHRRTLALLMLALVSTGCGWFGVETEPDRPPLIRPGDALPPPPPDVFEPVPGGETIPPVVLAHDDTRTVLQAISFCFGGMCADGIFPETPEDIGSPAFVEVTFALPGWDFNVDFQEVGGCEASYPATTTPIDANSFRIDPTGPAGVYDVVLFGVGDGDLSTVFRWTTTTDGPGEATADC